MISRRSFLTASGVFGASFRLSAASKLGALRIGVTDWDIQKANSPESLATAQSLGFEGVQLRLDREKSDERLVLASPERLEKYLAESRRLKFPIVATSLAGLKADPKQSGKLGEKWVASGIEITSKLSAGVLLVPFFFKDAPFETTSAYVVSLLKDLIADLHRAGIVVGLESWLTAADCARIMDRLGSPAVRMYYDVGISTRLGYDVPAELRWLGKARIAQIHLKDDVQYFGQGKVDFPGILRAISDIGYEGFAVLEKSGAVKSTTTPEDMRRNLEYIRGLIEKLRRG